MVWEPLRSHRIYGSGAGKVSRLNIPWMRRKAGTRRLQIHGMCVPGVIVLAAGTSLIPLGLDPSFPGCAAGWWDGLRRR